MNQTRYYYTYYSYEEWGRGYIGSRGCKCLPEEDTNYLGSSKDKTFKPTHKIILKSDYVTREEAYVDEIILQGYYKVVENPHFVNRAYQTSTKFSYRPSHGENAPMFGKSHSEETKRKMSEIRKGVKHTKNHRKNISKALMGKSRPEEVKQKISNTRKMRNIGIGKKHSEKTKIKMSEIGKGMVFWNNGKINKKSKECPGNDWKRGRLKK